MHFKVKAIFFHSQLTWTMPVSMYIQGVIFEGNEMTGIDTRG